MTVYFYHNLAYCADVHCQDQSHVRAIDKLYEDICTTLHSSSDMFKSCTTRRYRQLPGWSEHCKDLHAQARDAFLLWRSHGSPKHGCVFDIMKKSRAYFKQALRRCKQSKDRKQMDFIAETFLSKDPKQFWKQIQHVNNKYTTPSATVIEGICGPENICNMWHDYFKNILNTSVDNNVLLNQSGTVNIENITASEVNIAIKRLKKGTSAGSDNLTSEHFIYAHENVCVLLSLLFNAMLIHNYLPLKFMDTVLIPILKDTKGDITDCNNYRPIAITCIMSKILETVILLKYQNILSSTDNQFAFKKKHSADQCIFILKEIIDFYTSNMSPVYICFMDASKAFDRVNHA